MRSRRRFQKDSFFSTTSRGLLSGFIAGMAGTAVKSLVEEFLPVRKIEERSAQIKILDELSSKIMGSPISIHNTGLAEQLVNFPVGASVGAAYGYGKKNKDTLNVRDGVILGATTWFSTHETSFPLLGLKPSPTEIPLKLQANELAAHVLFGITTEVVRHFVHKRLSE